jgi:triosephosphate isomerase (TIM)
MKDQRAGSVGVGHVPAARQSQVHESFAMSNAPRPLVAGNWKMNGLKTFLAEVQAVQAALTARAGKGATDVMLCPPATLVLPLAQASAGSRLMIGAQDCHTAANGAHTGDISAEMLKDAGAVAVIVGHSERRADHAELDAMVQAKAQAAHRAGLIAIICAGETAGQRHAGLTLDVVGRQLRGSLPKSATSGNTVIAYEPVWAIGTGLVPTSADVAKVHEFMRATVSGLCGRAEAAGLRLLYGGSVKASNAKELMAIANVDGALVGGASLKADDFLGIVAAYG